MTSEDFEYYLPFIYDWLAIICLFVSWFGSALYAAHLLGNLTGVVWFVWVALSTIWLGRRV